MYKVCGKSVVEKTTGRVIEIYKTISRAKEVCQSLNEGAGFQGWTPDFFCTKKRGVKI